MCVMIGLKQWNDQIVIKNKLVIQGINMYEYLSKAAGHKICYYEVQCLAIQAFIYTET